MREAEGRGRGGRDERGREDRRPRQDFGGAPRDDFGAAPQRQNFEAQRSNGNSDIVRQLEMVNSKLDRLVRAFEKPLETAQPKIESKGTLKQVVKRAMDSKKKK